MTWIAFSEREPTDEEKMIGILCATLFDRRKSVWKAGEETCYYEIRRNWTHFCPVTPPTDLPPKPLPELSEGSEWERKSGIPSIYRRGVVYWLSTDGKSLVWCRRTETEEPASFPLADIEALKEAGK